MDTDTEVDAKDEDVIETEGNDDELVDQGGDDEYLDAGIEGANAGNGEIDEDEEYTDEEVPEEGNEDKDNEDAVDVIEDAADVIVDNGQEDVDRVEDSETDDIPEGDAVDVIEDAADVIVDNGQEDVDRHPDDIPEGSGEVPEGSGDDLDQESGTEHPLGEGIHIPEGSGDTNGGVGDTDDGSEIVIYDQGSGTDPEYATPLPDEMPEIVTDTEDLFGTDDVPDEDPENEDDDTRIVGVGGQEDDLDEGSGLSEPNSPEDDTTAVPNDKVANDETTSSPDDDYPDIKIVGADDTTRAPILEDYPIVTDTEDLVGGSSDEEPDLQDEGSGDVSAEIEDITTVIPMVDTNDDGLSDDPAYDDDANDNAGTTSDPNADTEYESSGGGFLSGYEDQMSQGRSRPSEGRSEPIEPLWKEKHDHPPGSGVKAECRSDIKMVMGRISRKIKEKHNHMMTATRIIVQVMRDTLDEL